MKLLATMIACALTAVTAVAEDKKSDFDAAKIEGKWSLVSGAKFGQKIEGKALEGTITITKDTITIKADMDHVMKFKLDTKASPVAITMVGEEGPSKGFTSEGIIELKGDELKLTYAMPMEKRPTAFVSAKDSKVLSFVLKRAK
ncbi:MAG: TIGR03067 domain-containing protein [Planctomycetes bacterium]|nr:TIGR03067 domain-containing protein [Planctomycetota bacterium]